MEGETRAKGEPPRALLEVSRGEAALAIVGLPQRRLGPQVKRYGAMPLAVGQQALPVVARLSPETITDGRGVEGLGAESSGGVPGVLDSSSKSRSPDAGARGEGEGFFGAGSASRRVELEPGKDAQRVSIDRARADGEDLLDSQSGSE